MAVQGSAVLRTSCLFSLWASCRQSSEGLCFSESQLWMQCVCMFSLLGAGASICILASVCFCQSSSVSGPLGADNPSLCAYVLLPCSVLYWMCSGESGVWKSHPCPCVRACVCEERTSACVCAYLCVCEGWEVVGERGQSTLNSRFLCWTF